MTSSNGSFFRITGPLCGEFTGDRWIPITKGQLCGLWCFFDVGRHEVLNKEWNDRRFETTWHSCDVILMTLIDVFQVWTVQFTCDWMDDVWMWRQVHSGFHQPPNVLKNRIVFFYSPGTLIPIQWNVSGIKDIFSTVSRFAASQWETALLCNDVSHWLAANLESALIFGSAVGAFWKHERYCRTHRTSGSVVPVGRHQ